MKFFFFPLLVILSSCALFSTEEETEVPKKRSYSYETDKTFEAIERGAVKNHVEDLHLSSKQKAKVEKVEPTKAARIREVKLKGNQNTVRELNQVLSYHCMKHRKRFNSEEACNAKVNLSIDRCEETHQKVTANFVRCLKDELKRI